MIRFALVFSLMTVPLAAPVAAQSLLIDPTAERPGRWISIPRENAPATIIEAPTSGPLITTERAPSVVMVAPEAAPIISPPRAAPDTRPVRRPAQELAQDVSAPAIAAEVVAALAVPALVAVDEAPLVEVTPVVEVSVVPAPTPLMVPMLDAVPDTPPAPAPIEDVAVTSPDPAPETVPLSVAPLETTTSVAEDPAAMAETLAALLAAQARQIVIAGPRALPQTSPEIGELLPPDAAPTPIAPLDQSEPSARLDVGPVLDPEALAAIEDVLQSLAADAARTRAPNAPAPMFVLSVAAPQVTVVPVSAVLLPGMARYVVSAVPPSAAVMPALERAPILPRLSPSGPAAMELVAALAAVQTTRLSAVVLPDLSPAPGGVPTVTLAAAPGLDLFPFSALPPSALPGGPEAFTRIIAPRPPLAAANAAVSITGPDMAPLRVRAPLTSVMPAPGEAPIDPNRAPELPAPDASAIARMMDDAQICWRLADLSVEAQWARVSVDVALDEWNMPSAASITFTGFAHVVSGAAEEAFRAAHSALIGCAMASENTPATTSTTLLFDRNGVHLR